MPYTGTRFGRTSPLSTEPAVVHADLKKVVDQHDDCPPHTYGPASARPTSTVISPGKPGRRHTSTDLGTAGIGIEEVDYGTGWTRTSTPNVGEQVVSALPVSPTPGQEIHYYFGANVVWHLKWLGYLGGSWLTGGGWFYLGGVAAQHKVDSGELTVSTSYAALPSTGPQVTVPLPGTYDVTIGYTAVFTTSTPDVAIMSYDLGGTAAADVNAADATGAAGAFASTSSTRRVTMSAGGQITAKYKTVAGQPIRFGARTMAVTPVRVG